jgi:hypothetical protein
MGSAMLLCSVLANDPKPSNSKPQVWLGELSNLSGNETSGNDDLEMTFKFNCDVVSMVSSLFSLVFCKS